MECSGSTVAVLRDNMDRAVGYKADFLYIYIIYIYIYMDRAVGYKADFLTLTLHPNPNRNAIPTRP